MRQPFWHRGPGERMTVTEAAEPPALGKPVIAAIDGYCVGGGLEWALRCDIRIATPRSSFGLPEPRAGTLAGFGLHMLSRLIPPGEALYMQLTGSRIDAARAYRCCLVQELVAPEHLLARAREIADMVLACSPMAIEAITADRPFRPAPGSRGFLPLRGAAGFGGGGGRRRAGGSAGILGEATSVMAADVASRPATRGGSAQWVTKRRPTPSMSLWPPR